MADKYWQDYEIGDKCISYGRQMTESDFRLLNGVAGGSLPIHTDPVYCKNRPELGRPIMPGSLVLGVIDSMFADHMCSNSNVFFMIDGYDKIRFMKPVFENDVLYVEFEVAEKAEVCEQFGMIKCKATVYNQENVPVAFAMERFRVMKRA